MQTRVEKAEGISVYVSMQISPGTLHGLVNRKLTRYLHEIAHSLHRARTCHLSCAVSRFEHGTRMRVGPFAHKSRHVASRTYARF